MNDTNELTIAAYEKHINEYTSGSPQVVDGHVKKWIDASLSNVAKNAQILEIGSGTGKDADYIESLGYTLERTDATRAFVDLLISKGHAARVFNAITDDILDKYDLIFADAVLLHFTPEETRAVIRKISNALQDEGKFVFSLKQGKGEELTDYKLGATRYFCFWQQDTISQVLRECGFDSVHITVAEDYRGTSKPAWLMIEAVKGK